jgi:hypothetical protein
MQFAFLYGAINSGGTFGSHAESCAIVGLISVISVAMKPKKRRLNRPRLGNACAAHATITEHFAPRAWQQNAIRQDIQTQIPTRRKGGFVRSEHAIAPT